jgi:signal transduction histidine kinase
MQRTHSLQVKVSAAFAAIVIGFVGTAAYVPRALWGYTLRAEEIQKRYAEAVGVLAELRGCGREIRQAALLAFHERTPYVRAAYEADVARARQRCASAVAVQSAAMRAAGTAADPARAAWEHFVSYDVPEHEAAVDAVIAQSHLAVRDAGVLRSLFETVEDGDSNLQWMVAIYAASAKTSAEQIHAGLQRLSSLYVALAGVGAAGAFILLVETVRIVRRYARAVDRQLADLDAFGGQVAHDLRGPLQTIQLAVSAIQKRTEDAAVQRLARGAASGIVRLDAMIRDLLQFARGGARAERASANVSTVLLETCAELLPITERAGVKVSVRAGTELLARIAPVALKTIVSNLVENAIKYRSSDRENEVVVTASAERHEVWIAVSDRGPGIDRELIPRLFEPFVRGSERPDSYGLGLATVKRLVDAHRGTISVQSTPESGTTFVIRLPAHVRRDGRIAAEADGVPAAVTAAGRRP